MSLKQDLRRWLQNYKRAQFFWAVGGGVLALLAAGIALCVTWWVIHMVLLATIAGLLQSHLALILATWAVLGLLFIAYVFADYRRLEHLEFESRDRLIATRIVSRVTGNGLLAFAAGPQSAMSFVKVLSQILLAGPLLTFTSLRLFARAVQLHRLDTAAATQALILLLKAGRKVSFKALASDLPEIPRERLLADLQLIDGVVIRRGEGSGVYLTETLQNDLAAARDQS